MKLKQFAAASLFAACAISAPAMAAVEGVQHHLRTGSLTNILTTLDIHQFDATLGTLTGITIEYGSAVSGRSLSNSSTTKNKTTTVGLTTTMTLTGPGALASAATPKPCSAACRDRREKHLQCGGGQRFGQPVQQLRGVAATSACSWHRQYRCQLAINAAAPRWARPASSRSSPRWRKAPAK
jgi:hypothetical protein